MAIGKAEVVAYRASQKAHKELVKGLATKEPDPSITVVTNADGSHSGLVVSRGQFFEVGAVTFIDLRA